MRIAYNPLGNSPLTEAPNDKDIIFDLVGRNIFAHGIKFSGTDNVFKKHTSDNKEGYNGLVPVPDYNNGLNNRFLKEDGTWATPANTWVANSKNADGYVLKGSGQANKVWQTDANGDPAWRNASLHTHTTKDITLLTSYMKGTTASALATTDTLNAALGKLEYKTDVAYNLVKGAYDGDGTIENLEEILRVLEGISDTDTIQAIVGKYLPLTGGTLTGQLKISQGNLLISSGHTITGWLYPKDDGESSLGQGIHRWKDTYTVLINGGIPLQSNNYNTYVPKLDGTGATGTWNISISGSANSAENASIAQTAIKDGNGDVITDTYVKNGSGITANTTSIFNDSVYMYNSDFEFTNSSLFGYNDNSDDSTWDIDPSGSANFKKINGGTPITSLNIGSQSVNYATYLGNSSSNYTKSSLDTALAGKLSLSGGTLTGSLTLSSGNITIPNYSALTSKTTSGTNINLLYAGNDDVIKIGDATTKLPIHFFGNINAPGGTLTGDLTMMVSNQHNEDQYIKFKYSTTDLDNYSWRLGYRGTGNANENNFIIQSNGNGSWADVLKFGLTDYKATFAGNVTAPSFTGNLSGNATSANYSTNAGNADTVDNLHASSFYVTGLGSVDAEANLQNIPKNVSGGWSVTHSGHTGMLAVLSQGQQFTSNRGIGFLVKGGQANRINLLIQLDDTWHDRGVIAYTSDIPTKVSHLTNDSGYLTSYTNNYITGFSWTDGTTSGPAATISRQGLGNIPVSAIPAASVNTSGIVTTGN